LGNDDDIDNDGDDGRPVKKAKVTSTKVTPRGNKAVEIASEKEAELSEEWSRLKKSIRKQCDRYVTGNYAKECLRNAWNSAIPLLHVSCLKGYTIDL
jgi:hypothetical protein